MATVELAIYDLTMGMAKQMAAPLAGLLDGKTVEMVRTRACECLAGRSSTPAAS